MVSQIQEREELKEGDVVLYSEGRAQGFIYRGYFATTLTYSTYGVVVSPREYEEHYRELGKGATEEDARRAIELAQSMDQVPVRTPRGYRLYYKGNLSKPDDLQAEITAEIAHVRQRTADYQQQSDFEIAFLESIMRAQQSI
ncbi:MAG: hypothetical protein HYW22_01925 [Candidatus Aenigmarchaeota archaeon]|nr:hypothetical protein [Candidatus Aenigmarchaeota archaeon]